MPKSKINLKSRKRAKKRGRLREEALKRKKRAVKDFLSRAQLENAGIKINILDEEE